ncbi:MAG: rhomboid family intramembrane serine protease [Actinomycetes bacterium]
MECIRRDRPDTRTRARYWNAGQPMLATKIIIAINVLVFIYTNTGSTYFNSGGMNKHLVDLGLAKVFLSNGEWYRLLTCGFIHFSFFHVGMNMFLLFQLGSMMEREMGRTRFALVYFAALLAGSAGALMANPNALTGGASGAVFGLMGAAFVGMRLRGINPMQTGLGLTLVLNLVLTVSVSGISIGGHLGGLAGGALCGLFLFSPSHRHMPQWVGYAAPVCVGLAAFLVAYSLV